MRLACLMAIAAVAFAQAPPRRRVMLDGFHNREPQPHYRWEATYNGGFSELAGLLDKLGAERSTVETALTPAVLANADWPRAPDAKIGRLR